VGETLPQILVQFNIYNIIGIEWNKIRNNIFFLPRFDLIIHAPGAELHHAVHLNKNTHIYKSTCLVSVTN